MWLTMQSEKVVVASRRVIREEKTDITKNALQLEAAHIATVVLRFNYETHTKFEICQRICV